MTNNYSADSIQVLSDLDHIRKNKGMYIGEAITPVHLLTECIDNALDETINGYSNGFEVRVDKLNDAYAYTVEDYGRGIPTGYKEVNGKYLSILEVLTTKSNSGGKFDNKSYLNSTGLHGLGLKCVNALSDKLIIKSVNNNKMGLIILVDGEPVNEIKYTDTTESSGTTIEFTIKNNNKYFENSEIPFDFIINKLNTYQAFGVKNIKLYADGLDVTDNFINCLSPFDLHVHPSAKENSKYALICDVNVKNGNNEQFRIAFNYLDKSTSYKFHGYTNYLYNKDGGGHITAAQKAIVKAFEIFCKNKNISIPSNMNSDYFIGLNCIVHCNIANKEFASQTKDKLITGTGTTKDYFNNFIDKLSIKIYEECFNKHVGITKALVQRIADYRKERENRKELKGLSQYIKINESTSNTVRRYSAYEKLTECSSKNRDECEIILTEGDSASGGLIRTRDKKTTAILPLKGKLKNITNCSTVDALKNKEISGIISSIGTGILDKCDIEKIRYNDVYYAGDADADGYHITNLVIALFVNFMPDVVKAGKFKLILSPLYVYKDKNNEWQGVNNIKDIPEDIVKKNKFTRVKGLGELDDDQIKEFLLNKDKRQVVTVQYPDDLEEFNNIMSTTEGKRDLLLDNNILYI